MAFRVVVFLLCLGLIQAKLLHLSCKQIRQLVDGHNGRRLALTKGHVQGQPAASDMKMLIWDEELAAKAGKWAIKNKFQHNPDKTVGSGRFRTGENLYIYSTTSKNFNLDMDMALKSWWDEHYDYQYKEISSSDFGGAVAVGHYTQMAWSESTRVGCGISQYQEGKFTNFLVVCNYGPSGNFIGQVPYPSGKAGGRLSCDGDCSRRYGSHC